MRGTWLGMRSQGAARGDSWPSVPPLPYKGQRQGEPIFPGDTWTSARPFAEPPPYPQALPRRTGALTQPDAREPSPSPGGWRPTSVVSVGWSPSVPRLQPGHTQDWPFPSSPLTFTPYCPCTCWSEMPFYSSPSDELLCTLQGPAWVLQPPGGQEGPKLFSLWCSHGMLIKILTSPFLRLFNREHLTSGAESD